MGQKCNPTGFRLGITETHRSRWFAKKKDYGEFLVEDQIIRKFVKKEFFSAGIARIDIERVGADDVKIIVHVARPGLVIGRRGSKVDKLNEELQGLLPRKVDMLVVEVDKPELAAQIVAESIAEQLEKRAHYRRAMRKYAETVMDAGALGVKILCSGRLAGAEIARKEKLTLGKVPLHTLRADINYGVATALTPKGSIGIKVLIFRGEILPGGEEEDLNAHDA